ncbi:117_t:CDS:2 [Paraglomus occultum]|uniref:117_t:CDS:1 n=1 Tax=Paraglomus occultum TaxID=144539 RepID=A0A9N8ZYR8_9GLOM|nr:117_t:CDS:2 [Paraglomus occultum]
MVCKKCEKKLGKVICPDKWKEGSRNVADSNHTRINARSVNLECIKNMPITAKHVPRMFSLIKNDRIPVYADEESDAMGDVGFPYVVQG